MIDERVRRIVDEAAHGNVPSRSDVIYLLGFDACSDEAAFICARAREIGMKACGGRGFVYAQIGVDQNPCPMNCRFCAFATVNSDSAIENPQLMEVPIERIVHLVELFDAERVDLISLMATAALGFDRYLEIVEAVSGSVSGRVAVMANAGDLTYEQTIALKHAGATCAYHALRLGEGRLTEIKPDTRRQTMENIREAGLQLMTGVEPLYCGADPQEIADVICSMRALGAFCMGACKLTQVQGVELQDMKPASTEYVRYVAAIARLVCGRAVEVGGIGGVVWVDAGCDPRARNYGEDDEVLRENIARARARLEHDGFSVGLLS